MVAGVVVGAYLVLIALARSQPPREIWHQLELPRELQRPAVDATFSAILDQEMALFAALEQAMAAVPEFPPASRYDPSSPTHPSRLPHDGNRSFVLTPDQPRGAALLLHGLSDSPASLRSLGTTLAQRGLRVIGLRLPGHGTVPRSLLDTRWEDWRDATAIALRELEAQLESGQPLIIVGYSNGAALALESTLTAIERGERAPDQLVFLSPAFAVDPLAGYARWQRWLSRWPGLGALAWESIAPEVDPVKYNSFPINAVVQIERLTRELEDRLVRLETEGRLAELPPVLTLQSVVDATISPLESLGRLYRRIHHERSELVLFDANRSARVAPLLASHVDELFTATAELETFPFATTLVTNATTGSLEVVARSRAAGSPQVVEEALGLRWPEGISSLSHVAIPFPPDHVVYGVVGELAPPLPFGRLEPRGERDLTVLPASLLQRQRWNPFYPYLECRVVRFLELGAC